MVAILKCLDPHKCTILIALFVAFPLPYYSAEHSGRKVVVKAFVTNEVVLIQKELISS